MLRRFPFRSESSALWRGFVTTFAVRENGWLVVRSFHAWTDSDFRPPRINGVAPVDLVAGLFANAAPMQLGEDVAATEMPGPDERETTSLPQLDDGDFVGSDIRDYDEAPQRVEESAPLPGEEACPAPDRSVLNLVTPNDSGDALSSGSISDEREPFHTAPVSRHAPLALLYEHIDVPVRYTGRLLLGNTLRHICIDEGFQPPFAYEKVLELTFEDGVLKKAEDVSAEAARKWERIAAQMEQEDRVRTVICDPVCMRNPYDLEYDEKWSDHVFVFRIPVSPLILLVDVSGVSSEEDLRRINSNIQAVFSTEILCIPGAGEIPLAVMEIGKDCRWLTCSDDLYLHASRRGEWPSFRPNGVADYAHVFDLLNRSLTSGQLLQVYESYRQWYTPSILLLSS